MSVDVRAEKVTGDDRIRLWGALNQMFDVYDGCRDGRREIAVVRLRPVD